MAFTYLMANTLRVNQANNVEVYIYILLLAESVFNKDMNAIILVWFQTHVLRTRRLFITFHITRNTGKQHFEM